VAFLGKIKQSFGSAFSFFAESWSELKKVRWPNRKELTSYTIVVLITVILVTLYFTVLDLGISDILRRVFMNK
jgi:preprotein translocase subunit SecE